MKKVIKANQTSANYLKIKSAQSAMKQLLNILDSMDRNTFIEFESIVGKEVYNSIYNGVYDLDQSIDN